MSDAKRRALHDLLDAVPNDVLDAAHAALAKLVDPVRHAFRSGSEEPDPVAAADGVSAATAEMARGDIVSLDEVEDEVVGRG